MSAGWEQSVAASGDLDQGDSEVLRKPLDSDEMSVSSMDPLTRRDFAGGGLATIALAWMMADSAASASTDGAKPLLHFPPKAKRVIQIFCMGGVSHVDTFDYKPDLTANDGKALTGKGTPDTFFGQPGNLMKPQFRFERRGKSGLWVSDLLPHLATCTDDMTFLYSMTSKSSNHTPATFFMNSCFTMNGFPCLGSWLSYGLGSQNEDLPTFVVLPDPRGLPAGGSINWTNGFLPAAHQGVEIHSGKTPVPDLFPAAGGSLPAFNAGSRFAQTENREYAKSNPGDSELAARIRSYELAARMQTSVPIALNLDKETEQTKRMYGLDRPASAGFAGNCLMARRLIEQGVRFVQVIHGGAFGGNPRINWDGHENLAKNHQQQAESMDQPVAALLQDLKQRGLLEDTLLVWTTEFGRTPMTQGVGAPGRDHHPHVFTVWMAGAGLRRGFGYGSSDEIGYNPGSNALEVYDLHATILHLLGLDHKRLTFYHNGIKRRLTDVHGDVIRGILS